MRQAQRVVGDDSLRNDARKALKRLTGAAAALERVRSDYDEARELLERLHRTLEERFGRSIPLNALLLDVLALVDVEEGDVWRWLGPRNNQGVPVIRVDRAEKTLVRYLALAFGVIGEDDFGVLYPAAGDPDDVNPWHRTLRRTTRPVGNPHRWAFTLEDPA